MGPEQKDTDRPSGYYLPIRLKETKEMTNKEIATALVVQNLKNMKFDSDQANEFTKKAGLQSRESFGKGRLAKIEDHYNKALDRCQKLFERVLAGVE